MCLKCNILTYDFYNFDKAASTMGMIWLSIVVMRSSRVVKPKAI